VAMAPCWPRSELALNRGISWLDVQEGRICLCFASPGQELFSGCDHDRTRCVKHHPAVQWSVCAGDAENTVTI